MNETYKRLPVTILSGFLDEDKTTLLNHILNNREGLRVTIVNDMSKINIDASLVLEDGAQLSRAEEKLVKMTNGCIWCTRRDHLLQEVTHLAHKGRFDYLLIESMAFPNRYLSLKPLHFQLMMGSA